MDWQLQHLQDPGHDPYFLQHAVPQQVPQPHPAGPMAALAGPGTHAQLPLQQLVPVHQHQPYAPVQQVPQQVPQQQHPSYAQQQHPSYAQQQHPSYAQQQHQPYAPVQQAHMQQHQQPYAHMQQVPQQVPVQQAHMQPAPAQQHQPYADDDATESEPSSRGGRGGQALGAGASYSQPSPAPSGGGAAAGPAGPAAAATRKGGGAKGGAKAARKPAARSSITLRMLIEEGVLQPGQDVLSVEYKGYSWLASLLPDGRISCRVGGQQMTFDSPSAFSIHVKRQLNPTRRADDGWKAVRYNGRVLEHFKAELAQRRPGEASAASSGATSRERPPPAAKRARVDSSSDLTDGSIVSATVKEGDRNVLKLRFARPKPPAAAAAAAVEAGAGPAGPPYPQQARPAPLPSYPHVRPARQALSSEDEGISSEDD